MSWKKACLIYWIALAVTALANIEKVSVWTDEHLSETPVAALTGQARRLRNVWRDSTVGALSRQLDCALAPFFDGTYKNSLSCRESPAQEAADQALRRRLDPKLPVLKADTPVDTATLLASLSPPQSPLPDACPALQTTAVPALDKVTPTAQPVLVPGKRQTLRKLLVVGDSLAIGLSLSLRRCVAELEGVELIEEGKVSSGLANPRYYDWGKALPVFLDKYSPDLVIIMMGANDAKYINVNEKPRPPGSPNKSWPEVFSMRVENFLAALTEKNIPSYWIGLPIMGDAAYAKQAEIMNDIVKAECAKAKSSRFLDTWTLLTDEQGNYSTFLPNDKGVKIKVRANDKVHFTVAGGDILAQSFLTILAKDYDLRPKHPREPEPAGRANASASSAP
jgi:uncharacterized protein